MSIELASKPHTIENLESFRRELQLYCYRLTGSLHDAEDVTQDAILKAWQALGSFRRDSSLKTWLYKIATNLCLDLLKKRNRRTSPELRRPAFDPAAAFPEALPEITWIEPFPDSWLAEANPEHRLIRREQVSLAFTTVLQLLPPRQRAILILRDVLEWSAEESAALLELSVAAINSALHRARVALQKHQHAYNTDLAPGSLDDEHSSLLQRYIKTWEDRDIQGMVALLREDAILTMPPMPGWYQGIADVVALLQRFPFNPELNRRWKHLPTRVNGIPAWAMYRKLPEESAFIAYGIHYCEFDAATLKVTRISAFKDASLLGMLGFPESLPAN